MKQKLFIFLTLILVVGLLVGLNAASFVQTEKTPDSEFNPNRSTFNTGATGTRAFFDLLAETGRRPVRWREKIAALAAAKNKPNTFVIVGRTRRDFTEQEIEQLLRWVSLGGRLVVIDRAPRADLIPTTANWRISADALTFPSFDVDPSNQAQMTEKTPAGKPVQPTVFTRSVNAVQPSRFASSIKLESFPPDETTKIAAPTPEKNSSGDDENDYEQDEPPAPKKTGIGNYQSNKSTPNEIQTQISPRSRKIETAAQIAPVVHVANAEKNLLADFPYGAGKIVFLSDPYVVSNAGIGLVDNAQLAINITAANSGGAIAFDEYHQGYDAGENRLSEYFAGTPLPAMLAQLLLLIGVILFTQSRRFARPLPAVEPNRLSKLEYVSAMAQLQQRTRAYDLALENIYTDFRRRTTRLCSMDNFKTTPKELAQKIAERTKEDEIKIYNLLKKCEDIIAGDATNKRVVLEIARSLREMEEKLGLKRAPTSL